MTATCGIRVDGRDVGLKLPDLGEAMPAVIKLRAHGFRDVEVFERYSGRTIPTE